LEKQRIRDDGKANETNKAKEDEQQKQMQLLKTQLGTLES
jgi:hypothetical protein